MRDQPQRISPSSSGDSSLYKRFLFILLHIAGETNFLISDNAAFTQSQISPRGGVAARKCFVTYKNIRLRSNHLLTARFSATRSR